MRKVLAQQSVGIFVRAALPVRPRVTKIDLDLGGQCQALMIGKLFASVPGQRPVKFTGQSLRSFDQRRDDAFSILVRDLDQHHVARMTLHKRCDIAVPGSADQSPSQWPGTARSSIEAGLSLMDTAFFIWPSPFRFRLACLERRIVRFALIPAFGRSDS